jgi:hypothetical protein
MTDDLAFDLAVRAVRSGTDPDEAAGSLVARMDEAERLGLLDGDEPFWPGMPDMMGKGYNLEPIVAGAVPRRRRDHAGVAPRRTGDSAGLVPGYGGRFGPGRRPARDERARRARLPFAVPH